MTLAAYARSSENLNNYPIFIAFDTIDTYERQIPISASWSLPDGQIKTTLITPDEDWEEYILDNPSIDIDLLIDQGATPAETLKELAHDSEEGSIFCADYYTDNAAYTELYEAINSDPSMELSEWQSTLDTGASGQVEQMRQWIIEQHSLNIELSEDRVKAMLFSYHELQYK
ncbi:hypothetical protein A3715_05050 [Oleiphilus sp. HI0009]|nr:hypothetical protein A3715_05050 [Oleiphilus sp. HI0009]KZY65055.1 hypothetical protein A3738_09345 [Oleiphilus sp. HI0066]